MCFSAPVSFAAAAALTFSGAVGVRIAARRDSRFIPINALAFCFATQQFLEGMIWSNLGWIEDSLLAKGFLFFALFLYPWFVAASCYKLTNNPTRQTILAGFIGAGLVYGTLLYGGILISPNFNVDLSGMHVAYQYNMVGGEFISDLISWGLLIPLYVILTIGPLLICDRPYAWAVGLLILATAILSAFVYTNFFLSVWCFFAAVVSIVISFWTYKVAR